MRYRLPILTAVMALSAACYGSSNRHSVELPRPVFKGMTVEDALSARRSQRAYTDDSLSIQELAQILYAAQGVTGKQGDIELRAAPSAGATYPLEIYVFVNRVKSLDPGIYRYLPSQHRAEVIRKGEVGESLSQACLGQDMPRTAACSVVITAVPSRTTERYGDRGMNYIYMEAGHVSQNIYLQCTSLGLGVVAIGAFHEHDLNGLIGIDGKAELSIYVNSIGRRPQERGEQQ